AFGRRQPRLDRRRGGVSAIWPLFGVEARSARVLTCNGRTATEPWHPRAHGEAGLRGDRRFPAEPAAGTVTTPRRRSAEDRRPCRGVGRTGTGRDHRPALLRDRECPPGAVSKCAGPPAQPL